MGSEAMKDAVHFKLFTFSTVGFEQGLNNVKSPERRSRYNKRERKTEYPEDVRNVDEENSQDTRGDDDRYRRR